MSRRHHPLRTRLVAALLGSAAGLVLTACGSGQITQTDAQTSAVDGASGGVGGMVVRNAFLAFPGEADEAPTSAAEGETQASMTNSYPRGADVPVVATFVNVGKTADELVAVRTQVSPDVDIEGPARFEPKSSITSTDEAPPAASAPPSRSVSSTAPGGPAGASAPASASASTAASGTTSPSTDASESGTSTAPGAPSAAPAPATPDNQLRIVLTNTTSAIHAGLPVEITFVFEEAGELTLDLPVGPPGGRGEIEVPGGVGPAQVAKIARLEDQLSGKAEDEAVEHYAEENGISHEDLEKIRESHGDGDERSEAGGSGGH